MLTKIREIRDKVSKILPSVREKLDAEKYGIKEFIKFASKNIDKNSILLDVGAGDSPYKRFFSCKYVSTDFGKLDVVDRKEFYKEIDVKSDACFLPLKSHSVDAVLNIQVLEHVKDPKKVIFECYRILKNGGELYLTAPQGWGQHNKPYDYFRFTSFALDYLFNEAGFKVIFINPRGGYFWYIGKRLRVLSKPSGNMILNVPFLILFGWLIPYMCFYLDKFDKTKDLTLGYACYCQKSKEDNKPNLNHASYNLSPEKLLNSLSVFKSGMYEWLWIKES